ncbi:uncharacterized protein LOC135442920 [Zonotrichia leucophrys gambelii]|uniref:uncharacterized protein LOC135442920 n=1 Tax=Zonotrichia leucophrys gambelii TaxID=257770 RepID=UPI0031406687
MFDYPPLLKWFISGSGRGRASRGRTAPQLSCSVRWSHVRASALHAFAYAINDVMKTEHFYLTLISTRARRGAQPPSVRHRSFPALPPAQPAQLAAAFACAKRDSPETPKPSLQRTGRNSKLVLLQRRAFGEAWLGQVSPFAVGAVTTDVEALRGHLSAHVPCPPLRKVAPHLLWRSGQAQFCWETIAGQKTRSLGFASCAQEEGSTGGTRVRARRWAPRLQFTVADAPLPASHHAAPAREGF